MKERIEGMLKSTKRRGIENLLDYMDLAGFYDAPCSSKYHLAKPGGLAEHSLNVAKCAMAIVDNLFAIQGKMPSKEFIDSIIICSLLHDLGKIGQFGKQAYKTDPENGGYKTNKDLLYIAHEIRSVVIASKYIILTEEEQHAILHHNGLYSELQEIKNNETPLYMILHFADLWACKVIESEERK